MKVKVINKSGNDLPAYATEFAAGLDVRSNNTEPIELKPGGCVNIPAGVKHWHGAAPDSWFSHLAIEVPGENAHAEWLEAVSDQAYAKLK